MATEQVLEVSIRRHIIESERPFASVLDGIFAASAGLTSGRCSATLRQVLRTSSSALSSSKRRAALGSCGSGSWISTSR